MYQMPRRGFFRLVFVLGTFGMRWLNPLNALSAFSGKKEETMMLPSPDHSGELSVEEAIRQRRTERSFGPMPVTKGDFSRLLYAAQGITEDRGFKRAAPSGGALYPMDVYPVVGEGTVEGLDSGVYHYIPSGHRIEQVGGMLSAG